MELRMSSPHRTFPQVSIHIRLTLWFVGITGVTLVALSFFLSARFLHSLSSSIDLSLQIAAGQYLANLEDESGSLQFAEGDSASGVRTGSTGISARLVSPDGPVMDQRGISDEIPAWGLLQSGYQTASRPGDDTQWRTYTEPVRGVDGSIRAWLQVTQPLDMLTNTQQDVRDQLMLIIPFTLLVLGAGGYFLASRALRPIDRITQTAGTISASDLSRRIEYRGPRDEVGRLAETFNAMLARLQAAFERERRFSADTAHELRTPLSVLKGSLNVALSRERTPIEYRSTLTDLRSSVERLISLSSDLLALSRLEQRRLEGVMGTVNLTDLLESILEQYQPLAAARNIELSIHLPPVLVVPGYSDALMRLFINLVDNAVKYTPVGGKITIEAGQVDDIAHVCLFNSTDNLQEADIPRLFERFYRADSSRSRSSGGTGLGLSIAREIAQAHGGRISARLKPGEGIEFKVEVPVERKS
jgi:heavy metal sensor kinase